MNSLISHFFSSSHAMIRLPVLTPDEVVQLNFKLLDFEWLYPDATQREDARRRRLPTNNDSWKFPMGRLDLPCDHCSTDIDKYFIRKGLAARGFNWRYDRGVPILLVQTVELLLFEEWTLLRAKVAELMIDNPHSS